MNKILYLDNAATTYPDKEVLSIVNDLNNHFNASSLYNPARDLSKKIEDSRKQIMKDLKLEEGKIFFNSGATEGNNAIVYSIVSKYPNCNIITSEIEHHSVLNPLKQAEKEGLCTVTYIKPEKNGVIDPKKVEDAITSETKLIFIMWVNNELGSINNLFLLSEIAHKNHILFASDCTQGLGKLMPDNLHLLDFFVASGHKIGALKGTGILYVKDVCNLKPYMLGGGQEEGLRAGTYNAPGILGFAKALSNHTKNIENTIFNNFKLKEYFINKLKTTFKDNIIINGEETSPIPIVNFSLRNFTGEFLLISLAQKNIYVSNGSACNTGDLEPSYVLKAINCPEEYIYSEVRASWGLPCGVACGDTHQDNDEEFNEDKINYFVSILKDICGE